MQIYGAYGMQRSPAMARTAYTGGQQEEEAGCYVLGDRLYSPTLRRFLNPDAISPFHTGGINRYAYCDGDPINRIDPGGNTWMDWSRASFGLDTTRGSPVATAGVSDIGASALTPSTLSLTAAGVMDATAPAKMPGSIASPAAGVGNAHDVLGWSALRTDASANMGAIARPSPKTPPSRHASRNNKAETEIQIISGPHPEERLRLDEVTRRVETKPKWIARNDPIDRRVTHWGADTVIHLWDVETVLEQISRRDNAFDGYRKFGGRSVYGYTGVHGHEKGFNWDWKDKRSRVDNDVLLDAQDGKARLQYFARGRTLHIEDIGRISKEEMRAKMSRPGHHINMFCFGAADPVVLEWHKVRRMRVYV
ncbi:MAG TPA: RHS repeat-associated core domain-containing protein [Luteibacter sp.]|nr:RHS repeat-associated core domain-containing protein [Luteibacter sp.]